MFHDSETLQNMKAGAKKSNIGVRYADWVYQTAKDHREGDQQQTEEEIEQRVAEESGGWFPKLDRGSRALTENTLESDGRIRANFVDAFYDGGDRQDLAENAPERFDQVEGALKGGEDSHWARKLGGSVVTEEAGLMFNLGTGLDPDTGERESSGIAETTAPAWYAVGPISRGAGAAVRGTAKMASRGALSQTARGSMRKAATYMPERLRQVAKAPVRQNADEGVKGATGSLVKTADSATSSIGNAVDSVPFGRTIATVGGVGATVGTLGNQLAGDVSALPGDATVMHVAEQLHNPKATVFEARKDESTLGYIVALSTTPASGEPEQVTMLTRPGGGVATSTVPWPPEPNFDSLAEARSAYDLLNRERNNPQNDYGNMDSAPYNDEPTGTWELPTHARALNGGWHLYVQEHATENRTRFIVGAYSADGTLLYLDSDILARDSFAAFKTRGEAEAAVQEFNRRRGGPNFAQPTPDASADKPTPADIDGTLNDSPLGISMSNSALVKIGSVLFAVVAGLILFGGK